MRGRTSAAVAMSALVVGLGVSAALADESDLDPSFSADGRQTTAIGSSDDLARDTAVDSQNRVVVVGTRVVGSRNVVTLLRYRVGGALDGGFSGDGIVTATLGRAATARAVAIDSEDRIVIAGSVTRGDNEDFLVARYLPDGTLDTTFADGGIAITDFGTMGDSASSIGIDSRGRIVVGGAIGFNLEFAVARYRSRGALDAAFSGDGLQATGIRNAAESSDLAIDSEDRIVIAGSSTAGGPYDFTLARYLPNGELDSDFSGDGVAVTSLASRTDAALGVTTDPSDRIVAVGKAWNGSDNDAVVARYRVNGGLDSSFSGDGVVITRIRTHDVFADVTLAPGGRILAAGGSFPDSDNGDFLMARYRSSGALDTGFSGDGVKLTSFGPFNDEAVAVVLDHRSRIVAAGGSYNGSDYDFAAARFLG